MITYLQKLTSIEAYKTDIKSFYLIVKGKKV